MAAALAWAALAASSLVIGALLAIVRNWPVRYVGLVLAFGAGALSDLHLQPPRGDRLGERDARGSQLSRTLGIWLGVAAVCTLATVVGVAVAAGLSSLS